MKIRNSYFAGYWITSAINWENEDGEPLPVTVLMFMDEGFLMRAVRTKTASDKENEFEVRTEFLSYFIYDDEIYVTAASNTTSEADEDWATYRWRVTNDAKRPLEFEWDANWEPFWPADLEIIVEAGFPRNLFEAWEKAAEKKGWSFSKDPYLPDGAEQFLSKNK